MSANLALKEQIISKVWEDEAFKQRLFENPKAAIQEEFGVEFPDSFEIEALKETSSKFFLVIPPSPAEGSKKEPKEFPMWS